MKENGSRKIIQILGTTSNSGKSTVTNAILRILSDQGLAVAPFKAVNMSLNSISIGDGSEIARSVWLQSRAARTDPVKEMNPFLLKPEADGRSQVIVLGRSEGVLSYGEYSELLWKRGEKTVRNSLDNLLEKYDAVIAEGSGSAAEINFNGRDLANSYISSIYGTPSILVGDIERGGVFASLFGTVRLMEYPDTLRWIIINRMRGRKDILQPGIDMIAKETMKEVIGVIPYLEDLRLPGEDSMDYPVNSTGEKIALLRYPFMENFSDLDPLILSGKGFSNITADNVDKLENADIIILPGSKDVLKDLEYLRKSGIDREVVRLYRSGARIMGICGGYQMLGKSIEVTVESRVKKISGLSLLDCKTVYDPVKSTRAVQGVLNRRVTEKASLFKGYEIHYGRVLSNEEPLCWIDGIGEGSVSKDGRIVGTNVHGMLENNSFAKEFLQLRIGDYDTLLERNLDYLAESVRKNVDLDEVIEYLKTD